MSIRDGLGVALVVMAVALTAVAGASAATQEECQPVGDAHICVTDVTISDDPLVAGDRSEITATIENYGDLTTSPAVVLNIVGPNNETGSYTIGEPAVEPGVSTTVSQPLDANTTGTHGFQVQLVDRETRRVYDTSDAMAVEVVDEAPPALGGPVDRVEAAVFALVAALAGIGFLAYRQFR